MRYLLFIFFCLSATAQNITNLGVGQKLYVGQDLTYVPSSGGASFQAEILAYGLAITNHSGTISNSDFVAFCNYIVAGKAHGWWSYPQLLGFFAGNTTSACVTMLKYTGTNPYVKLVNFNSSSWSKTKGWLGNGTGIIDTLYTNSPALSGSNGMALWITYPTTNMAVGSPFKLGGVYGAADGSSVTLNLNSAGAVIPSSSLAGSYIPLGPTAPPDAANNEQWTPGAGWFGYTTVATNQTYVYQNGAVCKGKFTATALPTFPYKYNTCVQGFYNGYGSYTPGDAGVWISGISCDSGMPTNLLQSFYEDTATLQRALGRGVDYPPTNTMKAIIIVSQSLFCGGGNGSTTPTAASRNQVPWALYTGGNPQAGNDAIVGPGSGGRKTLSGYVMTSTETGFRALTDQLHYCITNSGKLDEPLIVLHWAVAGQSYAALKKGGSLNLNINGTTNTLYNFSTLDVTDAANAVSNLFGKQLEVIGIVGGSNESDGANTNYLANLKEWIANYAVDVQAITGQSRPPKMYFMQLSTIGYPNGTYPYSSIATWQAEDQNSISNLVAAPRYMMFHAPDNIHLYDISYRRQGEYLAESLFNDFWNGGFSSLRPTNVSRSTTTITLTMNKSGLVIDTNNVKQAFAYGFNYTNTISTNYFSNISTVAISGATSNQVTITLSTNPAGLAGTLFYALNCTNGTPGPVTGARGNLRDQYPDVGITTTSNLFNWCDHFQLNVP